MAIAISRKSESKKCLNGFELESAMPEKESSGYEEKKARSRAVNRVNVTRFATVYGR
jgi:hypothetical protein